MADAQKIRPWWQTLPAVLAGIAAVLTAAASLVVALRPAGVVDPDSPDPPASSDERDCDLRRAKENTPIEALDLVIKVGEVESANRLASLRATRKGEPGASTKLRDLTKGKPYPFVLTAPDGSDTSYSITITDIEDRKRTKPSDWGYDDMAEIEVCKRD